MTPPEPHTTPAQRTLARIAGGFAAAHDRREEPEPVDWSAINLHPPSANPADADANLRAGLDAALPTSSAGGREPAPDTAVDGGDTLTRALRTALNPTREDDPR